MPTPGRRQAQHRRRRGSQPARKARASGKRGLARRGGGMLAVTGAGAAMAYFFNRKEGRHRREMMRERAAEMAHIGRGGEHEHNGAGPEKASDAERVESPLQTPRATPGAPGTPGTSDTPGTPGTSGLGA